MSAVCHFGYTLDESCAAKMNGTFTANGPLSHQSGMSLGAVLRAVDGGLATTLAES
jgi:hypothetical protein